MLLLSLLKVKVHIPVDKESFMLLNIELLFLQSAENNLKHENLTITMKTKRQKNPAQIY